MCETVSYLKPPELMRTHQNRRERARSSLFLDYDLKLLFINNSIYWWIPPDDTRLCGSKYIWTIITRLYRILGYSGLLYFKKKFAPNFIKYYLQTNTVFTIVSGSFWFHMEQLAIILWYPYTYTRTNNFYYYSQSTSF